MTIFKRLAKINWIGNVLAPLSIVLMETLWFYPWLVFISKWMRLTVQGAPLSLASLIIILGASFMATRFLLSRKWSFPWIRAAIIIGGLVVIFLVVHIEYISGFKFFSSQWFTYYSRAILDSFSHPHPIVFAIPAGFYLWWRGIHLGRSPLSSPNIYRAFFTELTLLILLVIIWGFGTEEYSFQTMISSIGIYVAGFFFFGLEAMALVNLQDIRKKLKTKDRVGQLFGRRWLSIITGITGGIVLIGVGFASAFSPQILSFLGKVLSTLSDVLFKIFYYVFYILGYVVEWLIYLIKLLVNWLVKSTPQQVETPEFLDPSDIPHATSDLSPTLVLVLKWLALAVVLGIVLFFIYRSITRLWSTRTRDEVDEEQESLWNWDEFKSDLLLWLGTLRNRFKRRKEISRENYEQDWQSGEDIDIKLSIREIYQHLLRRTKRLGMSREDYETPYEYASRMATVIPEGKEPFIELTGLYVDARYGEQQMANEKVDTANNLWRMLRTILTGHSAV
ncbi:MAG: DUF4129 domain-containing protein [Dehalococcoidales bacterium]|nr:DUF4129 domain-containing protein [Dehalococcoidales bacterium]